MTYSSDMCYICAIYVNSSVKNELVFLLILLTGCVRETKRLNDKLCVAGSTELRIIWTRQYLLSHFTDMVK